jgi:hypothetical protein
MSSYFIEWDGKHYEANALVPDHTLVKFKERIYMRKKLLPIILFLFILVTLTSCCRDSYSFKEPINEIENIEIVSAENSLAFTVIKTLSETEKKSFLNNFKLLNFKLTI